jgi:hypothetical protein
MHNMILPCPVERYTKKYNEYLNDLGEQHHAGVIIQTNYKAEQVAIKTLILVPVNSVCIKKNCQRLRLVLTTSRDPLRDWVTSCAKLEDSFELTK